MTLIVLVARRHGNGVDGHTLRERTADIHDARGEVDVCQRVAGREQIVAQRDVGIAFRELDQRERRPCKREVADGLQIALGFRALFRRGGEEFYGRQGCTVGECARSDGGDACRQDNFGKSRRLECAAADLRNGGAVFKVGRREQSVVAECAGADDLQLAVLGKSDRGERIAEVECACADGRQACRQADRDQVFVILEGVVADGRYRVGHDEVDDRCSIESIFFDGHGAGSACRERDVLQSGNREGALADAGDRGRDDHADETGADGAAVAIRRRGFVESVVADFGGTLGEFDLLEAGAAGKGAIIIGVRGAAAGTEAFARTVCDDQRSRAALFKADFFQGGAGEESALPDAGDRVGDEDALQGRPSEHVIGDLGDACRQADRFERAGAGEDLAAEGDGRRSFALFKVDRLDVLIAVERPVFDLFDRCGNGDRIGHAHIGNRREVQSFESARFRIFAVQDAVDRAVMRVALRNRDVGEQDAVVEHVDVVRAGCCDRFRLPAACRTAEHRRVLVTRGVESQALQRCGQTDFRQTVAVVECRMADGGDALREVDVCKPVAEGECFITDDDGVFPLGKDDRGERVAVEERLLADGKRAGAVREDDAGQQIAVFKRAVADGSDLRAERDGRQVIVVVEDVCADLLNGFGEDIAARPAAGIIDDTRLALVEQNAVFRFIVGVVGIHVHTREAGGTEHAVDVEQGDVGPEDQLLDIGGARFGSEGAVAVFDFRNGRFHGDGRQAGDVAECVRAENFQVFGQGELFDSGAGIERILLNGEGGILGFALERDALQARAAVEGFRADRGHVAGDDDAFQIRAAVECAVADGRDGRTDGIDARSARRAIVQRCALVRKHHAVLRRIYAVFRLFDVNFFQIVTGSEDVRIEARQAGREGDLHDLGIQERLAADGERLRRLPFRCGQEVDFHDLGAVESVLADARHAGRNVDDRNVRVPEYVERNGLHRIGNGHFARDADRNVAQFDSAVRVVVDEHSVIGGIELFVISREGSGSIVHVDLGQRGAAVERGTRAVGAFVARKDGNDAVRNVDGDKFCAIGKAAALDGGDGQTVVESGNGDPGQVADALALRNGISPFRRVERVGDHRIGERLHPSDVEGLIGSEVPHAARKACAFRIGVLDARAAEFAVPAVEGAGAVRTERNGEGERAAERDVHLHTVDVFRTVFKVAFALGHGEGDRVGVGGPLCIIRHVCRGGNSAALHFLSAVGGGEPAVEGVAEAAFLRRKPDLVACDEISVRFRSGCAGVGVQRDRDGCVDGDVDPIARFAARIVADGENVFARLRERDGSACPFHERLFPAVDAHAVLRNAENGAPAQHAVAVRKVGQLAGQGRRTCKGVVGSICGDRLNGDRKLGIHSGEVFLVGTEGVFRHFKLLVADGDEIFGRAFHRIPANGIPGRADVGGGGKPGLRVLHAALCGGIVAERVCDDADLQIAVVGLQAESRFFRSHAEGLIADFHRDHIILCVFHRIPGEDVRLLVDGKVGRLIEMALEHVGRRGGSHVAFRDRLHDEGDAPLLHVAIGEVVCIGIRADGIVRMADRAAFVADEVIFCAFDRVEGEVEAVHAEQRNARQSLIGIISRGRLAACRDRDGVLPFLCGSEVERLREGARDLSVDRRCRPARRLDGDRIGDVDAHRKPADAFGRDGNGGCAVVPDRVQGGIFVQSLAVFHHSGEFGGILAVAHPPAEERLAVLCGQRGQLAGIDVSADRLGVRDRFARVIGTRFIGHDKALRAGIGDKARIQREIRRNGLCEGIDGRECTVLIPADKDGPLFRRICGAGKRSAVDDFRGRFARAAVQLIRDRVFRSQQHFIRGALIGHFEYAVCKRCGNGFLSLCGESQRRSVIAICTREGLSRHVERKRGAVKIEGVLFSVHIGIKSSVEGLAGILFVAGGRRKEHKAQRQDHQQTQEYRHRQMPDVFHSSPP